MRRTLCTLVAFTIIAATAGPAWAGWCDQVGASIFCDDFDRYCAEAPAPPQTCTTNSTRSDAALREVWVYSSWDYQLDGSCGSVIKVEDITEILASAPYGGRHPNSGNAGGTLGQNTLDLTPHIQASLNGSTVVNGTDENPLVLTFTMSALARGLIYSSGYLELALGDPNGEIDDLAQAPTDFVLVGADNGSGCISCKYTCPWPYSSVDVAWPSVCQQDSPHPLCPPKQTLVRNTLALGALSTLDNNPCHCIQDILDPWQVPTNYHLSYFDGQEWHVVRTSEPGTNGDFSWGTEYDTVVFTIKTNTVDIAHTAKLSGTTRQSRITGLPRHYTGGFNRLRAGTGVSCRLNNDTYTCSPEYAGGNKKCKLNGEFTCSGSSYISNRSKYVTFDNVNLSGGEGEVVPGACCKPDATCVETDLTTCEQVLGGRYQGDHTTCDATSCCPYPFADLDTDGDVDQDDFGLFQVCSTGFEPTVPAGCECLNRNGDASIDEADFAAFDACFTGPNVPALPTPAGCNP